MWLLSIIVIKNNDYTVENCYSTRHTLAWHWTDVGSTSYLLWKGVNKTEPWRFRDNWEPHSIYPRYRPMSCGIKMHHNLSSVWKLSKLSANLLSAELFYQTMYYYEAGIYSNEWKVLLHSEQNWSPAGSIVCLFASSVVLVSDFFNSPNVSRHFTLLKSDHIKDVLMKTQINRP